MAPESVLRTVADVFGNLSGQRVFYTLYASRIPLTKQKIHGEFISASVAHPVILSRLRRRISLRVREILRSAQDDKAVIGGGVRSNVQSSVHHLVILRAFTPEESVPILTGRRRNFSRRILLSGGTVL